MKHELKEVLRTRKTIIMSNGWVKSYRKTMNSPIFDNPNLFKVFHWCLYRAAHKERRVVVGMQEITPKPGQVIFGRKSAPGELKMSESSVRNYMDPLSGCRRGGY